MSGNVSLPAERRCALCGLPTSGRAVKATLENRELVFCCSGCLLVMRITGECGEAGSTQALFLRLGLGIFFAVNAMAFTLPAYFPIIYDAVDSAAATGYLLILRTLALIFTLPVLGLLGWPILQETLDRRRQGPPAVDALIITATAAAFGLSVWNTIHGMPHVYFDTVAMLLVLVTMGRYLEARAKLTMSSRLTPFTKEAAPVVTRIAGSREQQVLASQLAPGERIRVLPGQMFAVDGIVSGGASEVDESSLTGASRPVYKTPGGKVFSGTQNLNGLLEVVVQHREADSTAARIQKILERAQRERGSFQRLAETTAMTFFPTVLSVSLLTFAFWTWREGLDAGVLNALAVLVVACPCAFGIAVPAATWLALGAAAAQGILVRSGAVMERLGTIQRIFLDKTGTLTSDVPELVQTIRDSSCQFSPCELHQRVAALQRYAPHPLGLAITRTFAANDAIEFTHVRYHPGLGIEGQWTEGNTARRMLVGSRRFLERAGLELGAGLATAVQRAEARGEIVALTGWNDRVQAVHLFRESLRPEVRSAIDRFRQLDLKPEILTGDRWGSSGIEKHLGPIPTHVGLLPEDKLDFLKRLRARGVRVGMVGDGINDAPALAAADVGVAVGMGTDIARSAAHVNIAEPDLGKLAWLLTYARKLRWIIQGNLFWAFSYNTVAVALAASGRLNPLIAAVAMVVSSLLILLNSRRLTKKPVHRNSRHAGWGVHPSRPTPDPHVLRGLGKTGAG